MTTFADGVYQYGGMPVSNGLPFAPTGNVWFVDPLNGADGNSGKTPKLALATLYQAHNKATANNNDVVYLIGNGAAAATARLSTALAQTIDSTATTGTLTWSKAATHLIGITAPTRVSQRARIAPPTGTYTAATFGSGNFQNIDVFNGFSTGGVNQIAWTDSGGRNSYLNMNFQGMGDAESAGDTGSRSLIVSGLNGENTFVNCTIGLDTIQRVSGASEMEFLTFTPRNIFDGCIILTNAAANANFWCKITANSIDRWVLFRNCTFINPTLGAAGGAATAMTVGFSIAASQPGVAIFHNCVTYGATKITASSLAVTNQPASAASGSLAATIA
jgi:hypothetical protein